MKNRTILNMPDGEHNKRVDSTLHDDTLRRSEDYLFIPLDSESRLEQAASTRQVLLHSCCAPCSGELMEAMLESGISMTIFFYNPNIHPKKEYEIRKNKSTPKASTLNKTVLYKLDNHTGPKEQPRRWMDKYAGKATSIELMNHDQYKIRNHKTRRILMRSGNSLAKILQQGERMSGMTINYHYKDYR